MDKLTVRELIQQECSEQAIAEEINRLLNDTGYRQQVTDNYHDLHRKMGEPGASGRTAGLIVRYLNK